MKDIKVTKTHEQLTIEWQTAEINILFEDIVEIIEDNDYVPNNKKLVKIGTQSDESDCILIRTTTFDYALFTMNKISFLNKISL
ncbi:SunI/YnzG family protein [Bacillus sp. C1]